MKRRWWEWRSPSSESQAVFPLALGILALAIIDPPPLSPQPGSALAFLFDPYSPSLRFYEAEH